MKTIKNKIVALIFIAIGLVPTIIDHDITCLLFLGTLAVCMFFAKESVFYED